MVVIVMFSFSIVRSISEIQGRGSPLIAPAHSRQQLVDCHGNLIHGCFESEMPGIKHLDKSPSPPISCLPRASFRQPHYTTVCRTGAANTSRDRMVFGYHYRRSPEIPRWWYPITRSIVVAAL